MLLGLDSKYRKVRFYMKKKIAALVLSMTTAFALVGCGDKSDDIENTEIAESTESTEVAPLPEVDLASYELNPEEFVTLCEYSTIPVTLTGDYDISEEDAVEYFRQMFENYGPFYQADPSKTTIEEGDIANVDYVGKLDGVAFDGGSAENQNIDVSNNSSVDGGAYIDGFTSGLLGASVGDVIDCDVTFPENYGNTDLAGKAVVFTFTVNSIQKEMEFEDVDDTFAQDYFQSESKDAMYAEIQESMQAAAENQRMNDLYTAVQDYLLANCTVDMPEDYFNDRYTAFKNMFITTYCGGDASQLESFLSTNYGYTMEDAETEWKATLTENVELEFIMMAIASKEGIEFDQEAYDAYMNNLVMYNGAEFVDAIYENYGYGDAAYGEKYMKDIYLANLALDKIQENAEITYAPAEDTETLETE